MTDREAMRELGNRIRGLRKDLGWTQDTLALIADIDRRAIGKIEAGQRDPHYTTMKRLADALNVSMETFLEGL